MLPATDDPVTSLIWANGHLISGNERHEIYIRDLTNGKSVSKGYLNYNTSRIWDLYSFTRIDEEEERSPNTLICADGHLISGHKNGTIKLRNVRSGQCIKTLEGHASSITALLWADGMLISGSEDRTIKIQNE